MKVELLYFDGCPNAEETRALVLSCARQLGLQVEIVEHDGDHPSPTVVVNGVDVMGEHVTSGRVCRLDTPTENRILDALRQARKAAPSGQEER